MKQCWVIPPRQNAAFVCALEDILDVYLRPFDPRQPLVCLDESSRQLMNDLRPGLPLAPGRPAREDCDFAAGPKVNLFMVFAPLLGWRRVKLTERRCGADWAELIRELVQEDFAAADKIVLVMDNLNTHAGASLYGRFPPAMARGLLERLEIHYTPKHGSWLNAAEIELSVLARQCLSRRIPTLALMQQAVSNWTNERNRVPTPMDWRFTTTNARITLKKLYTTISV